MASIFTTGGIPTFTKEQQKIRRLAWKPNTSRTKAAEAAPAVTVFRSEKAQAEFEAREAAKAAEKVAKRQAAFEKAAATRAANAKTKAKSKAKSKA